ncbi:hypothetical protein [Parasulfitobacter algicola]|uniref:Uncharacterized protein n=1 Tax=Parasulfitobacter algicola TaxID=2614809 RepID=A0ABX2IS69_9RHOB|nr:hypothetical protein [Sulfitobacter algicola]NSX55160.1 hypothetical protein [Sulfitobacter algicola]
MKRSIMPTVCLVFLCLIVIGMGTIALTVQSIQPTQPLLAALMRIAPFAGPAVISAFVAFVAANHDNGKMEWLGWLALAFIPFVMIANMLPVVLSDTMSPIISALWQQNNLRPGLLSEPWQNWSLLWISCVSVMWLFSSAKVRLTGVISASLLLIITLIFGVSAIALHTTALLIVTTIALLISISRQKHAAIWYAVMASVTGLIGLAFAPWGPFPITNTPQFLDSTYNMIAQDSWLVFTVLLMIFFSALVFWVNPRLPRIMLILHAGCLGVSMAISHISQFIMIQSYGDIIGGPAPEFSRWFLINDFATMTFFFLALIGVILIILRHKRGLPVSQKVHMTS